MGRELSPAELHELLGAYALDAVDADEREQVEAYLARTPSAVAEVSALQETAALLAHVGREAPDGLWSRIEGALAEEPPHLVLPIRPTAPDATSASPRIRPRSTAAGSSCASPRSRPVSSSWRRSR